MMKNKRRIRYHPCSTICHGECEVVLVKQLQLKYKKTLNPLSEKKGRNSIIINTVNDYLLSHYPTRGKYTSHFSDCIKFDKKKIYDHRIYSIMDKDDTPDSLFDKYVDKSLFNQYWWGKENYIHPIYFNPSMDVVFKKYGFPIDTSYHKPAQYLKLLTTRYDEVIKMLKSLSYKESNIKDFIEYIENYKY